MGGEQGTVDVWTQGSVDVNDGKRHPVVGAHDGVKVCLYIDGILVDVRIYSYALSPEEVKMLYEDKEPPRERSSE